MGQAFPVKNRKGFSRDVFGTFAIHAGLVYDVTEI